MKHYATPIRILVPVMALLGLPFASNAQFTLATNNGTITIKLYTGSSKTPVIPSTTNGYPVTSIGDQAFMYSAVTSVTIPNGITNIGSGAFEFCSSLAGITLPNSATNIAAYAFLGSGLTNIVIPTGVKTIFDQTFEGCASLKTATIPNSVTNILCGAFQASGITNITIPSSVIAIWCGAFANCSSLKTMSIPSSVTSMDYNVFDACTNLTAITVDALNPAYSSTSGVLFDKNQHTLIKFPGGKAGNYSVPSSVTSIGFHAFQTCAAVTNIMIPSSVVSLGLDVFGNCSALLSISVDSLNPNYSSDNGVLFDKNQQNLIQFPAGKGSRYTVPKSATSIAASAFEGCVKLVVLFVPNSVLNIGSGAFSLCVGLTNIYFLGNVPILGSGLFSLSTPVPKVFFLPETTGWNTTFDSASTLFWNPSVSATNANFGIKSNQFGFVITGTTNIPIVVEANTNLATTNWSALQTCTLTNGSVYFRDAGWSNYPSRVYRIRSQ